MRFKNIYIFIIVLSLLIPQGTDQDNDANSIKEKKRWSLFKKKDKEYKEKSDRKGFLGIFKRKRKKDAEEDLLVTEEERERQETKDGQEIVRIPFTPVDGTEEVLSSSQPREIEIPPSEEQSEDQKTKTENDSRDSQNSEEPSNLESITTETDDEKKNKEIFIYKDKIVEPKEDEGPSWPFTLSSSNSNDETKSNTLGASNNQSNNLAPVKTATASAQNTAMAGFSGNDAQNQLLQTIIDQNKKIDILIESINQGAVTKTVSLKESSSSKVEDLNSGESQDMLELLQIVQNKFFEIESMLSGSDSLYISAHDDIKGIMVKMESMNMRLETKIQSLELSLGLLEGDLGVRVDSLERNMFSRDSRIDELEDLNKDLVMQMLKLDNKLATKVIKLENKILELDSGYSNLKDLNKDLVFNVLNQSSSSANTSRNSEDSKEKNIGQLKISKSEYKKRYDKAYTRYLDGDYNRALTMFNSLLELENINDLTDNCQYWVGEIHYATRDFRNAIVAFNKVFNFKENNKKSYAQYKLGLCYLNIKESQNAVSAFQKVVDNYPKQSDLVRKSNKFIQKYR